MPRERLGILLDSRRTGRDGQTMQPGDGNGAGQQAPLTLSESQFVMHLWRAEYSIGQASTPPPFVNGEEDAVLATQDWWIQRKKSPETLLNDALKKVW